MISGSLFRRSTFWLASLTVALFLAIVCFWTTPDQPTRAATWQGVRPPNILFALADDASFPHMGVYGCAWVRTPAFDRVAREGILFTNAYTPDSKCAPSRASILTGRNSWNLEQAANQQCAFPTKFTTWLEALGKHGYHVGMTGKGWGPGVARTEDGRRREMLGRPYSEHEQAKKGLSNNNYAANFADFLDDAQGRPWAFWYGAREPHRPYRKRSGLESGKKLADIDHVPAFWPDDPEVRSDMLDYAVEIEHFDTHLMRMIELLEAQGQLDNTIIVVTSDNGMPFPRAKGNAYELSNHMPLAIMWKRGIAGPGRVVDDYISFVDFAPTFIEAAGMTWQASRMAATNGRSLFEIFRSEQSGRVIAERDHVLIGRERHSVGRPGDVGYPIRGIVTDGWLYLHNFEPDRWPGGNPETGYADVGGSPTKTIVKESRTNPGQSFWQLCFGKRPAEELYNLAADRDCVVNLAADAQNSPRAAQMKSRLFALLREQDDPRILGNGDIFDSYPWTQKKTVDFYERRMRGEDLVPSWIDPSDFDPEAAEEE